MPARRTAFLLELPGDPMSDYLKAVLELSSSPETAALVIPALTPPAIAPLAAALSAGRPAFLPLETLPDPLPPALWAGLRPLLQSGLIPCPLTQLPRWVKTGVSCPALLTQARLNDLAAQGFDRVYLAAVPGATPLARRTAKALKIQLTGGSRHGVG